MKKGKVKQWINRHKGVIFVGGVGIFAFIAWSLLRGEKQALLVHEVALPEDNNYPFPCTVTPLTDCPNAQSNERLSHDVATHIRNLPVGWNASEHKIETAAAHGYDLKPGQTWVESYRTGI